MRGDRYLPFIPPAVAILAFLPILRNDFVNHEDYWMVVHNPHLVRLSWAELRWMLTSFEYGSYHPLGWLLLALLRAAFGVSPLAHHAAGLALHAASAYLLFRILETLLKGDRRAAAAAATMWAVHPLQLELVGWAVELPDMLAVTLALGSALAYLKGKLPAGVILFSFSLLARWKAVALPVALLLWEVRRPKRRPARTLPFFALAALFAWLNAKAKTAGPGHTPGLGPEFAAGALFYLGKALAPVNLTLDYALTGSAAHTAAFLALTGAAFYLRKRAPAVPAAWTLYLTALAPTLLVSYFGAVTAHDRFFYVPSLALAGLLAAGLSRAKAPALAAAAAACIVLASVSWKQTAVWRDSVSLWTHVLSQPGAPPYARLSLAFGLMERGRDAEAEAALRRHLALYPGDPHAEQALSELVAKPR